MERKILNQKKCHDRHAKPLRPLAVGDNVTFDRFDSLRKKPVWDKGVIYRT